MEARGAKPSSAGRCVQSGWTAECDQFCRSVFRNRIGAATQFCGAAAGELLRIRGTMRVVRDCIASSLLIALILPGLQAEEKPAAACAAAQRYRIVPVPLRPYPVNDASAVA